MKADEKVMFAVAPRGDGGTDVLLGVPTSAWEYMKDGKTHTFDLTKLGLPIRIIMCGGRDQRQIRDWIDRHNKSLGIDVTENRMDDDFSIRPIPREDH